MIFRSKRWIVADAYLVTLTFQNFQRSSEFCFSFLTMISPILDDLSICSRELKKPWAAPWASQQAVTSELVKLPLTFSAAMTYVF